LSPIDAFFSKAAGFDAQKHSRFGNRQNLLISIQWFAVRCYV
jgi:hypothetical protein